MAKHCGKDWGKKRHTDGQERVNWHEIKSAIIYRLKDQVELSPVPKSFKANRAILVKEGF